MILWLCRPALNCCKLSVFYPVHTTRTYTLFKHLESNTSHFYLLYVLLCPPTSDRLTGSGSMLLSFPSSKRFWVAAWVEVSAICDPCISKHQCSLHCAITFQRPSWLVLYWDEITVGLWERRGAAAYKTSFRPNQVKQRISLPFHLV